ncbi:glycine betaine/L-proline ABC transporter ATP-binding protein [Maritimibacter alkaliphilus]|uniref:quaternary amine ABC transporter ATP-binding protein n=1 Tax=Maritimibacter alkaliphilus TaxID=404236 RepID=UPI001C97CFCE|nr:betaine/proline/choline family ABC transporter ATP-binding protein [Maritimibacter alkaliphilus]MBY6088920.1 betaine/proline/choline family ABC transporter ATP-binding protein [Maritimibacter alkaliphilus]
MISQAKTDQTDRDISTVTDRIEIRDVYKIFGRRKEEALALVREGKGKSEILERTQAVVGVNNVSLSVPKGSISVIMGLSGSGKSTLARCVNRILEPDAGQILLDGEDYTKCSDARMREIRRRRISMVFQNFGLLPNQTVIDNVAFGLKLRKVPLAERHKKAGEMLETVGLSEWASHLPGELSGGMRQRVGLARALATEADVLIMDEAFSALDPLIRTEMQDELLRLQNTLHKTVLFITHDFQEALRLGTKIAVMADGAVIRDGTPQEIVIDPGHDYVAAFTRNVDRARLFDAASVMSESPADAQGGRFVLNDAGEVAGWQDPVTGAVSEGFLAVRPETTLIEIAGAAARRRGPIAVVDAEGKFRGRISDEALLAGIAGAKETMKGSRTDA